LEAAPSKSTIYECNVIHVWLNAHKLSGDKMTGKRKHGANKLEKCHLDIGNKRDMKAKCRDMNYAAQKQFLKKMNVVYNNI
jgi:hypothetical protein